jgi:hypothetical protein
MIFPAIDNNILSGIASLSLLAWSAFALARRKSSRNTSRRKAD